MKKLLTIVSLATAALANCAPVYSQQLTLDQMIRMTGGNQAHLPNLQTQYDTRGFQVNVSGRGVSPVAQYGYSSGSAGIQEISATSLQAPTISPMTAIL